MNLYPALFSKAKTVESQRQRLRQAPQQKDNSKEAWQGLVSEFTLRPGPGPVATLSELHEIDGVTEAVIHCVDGQLHVVRDAEGNWSEKNAEQVNLSQT